MTEVGSELTHPDVDGLLPTWMKFVWLSGWRATTTPGQDQFDHRVASRLSVLAPAPSRGRTEVAEPLLGQRELPRKYTACSQAPGDQIPLRAPN